MTLQYLPKTDHVIRLVKPSLLMRDESTGAVVGCFPGAFKLREADKVQAPERNLSVNWLEFFSGTKGERLQQVRDNAELRLSPNHGFASLNVGVIYQTCEGINIKIRVLHEPTLRNPSHSAIHRYPCEHDELFALLANIASQDLTLSRDIPASDSSVNSGIDTKPT